jgi:hypothetical protein
MIPKVKTIVFLFFLAIAVPAFAQQQGLGIVFSEKTLAGKNFASAAVQPLVQVPPLCGKKKRDEGFNLPLPFGTGIRGFWYRQDYLASNLLVIDSTEKITVTADTMIQNTRAGEMQLSLRPDIWLFPFLNVYGIFGYTKGTVKPNLTVPSFTMHIRDHAILPDNDIPIDTTFEIKEELAYNGPVVGGGLTFAMGFRAFFLVIDYNFTVTYPNDDAGNLTTHLLRPKIGLQLASKNGKGRAAIWLGAAFMHNKQTFRGVLNVEEISPVVALILGKEADYSGDIENIQHWNMLIGASYFINQHHNLFLELGFIGLQQASLGYGFRF